MSAWMKRNPVWTAVLVLVLAVLLGAMCSAADGRTPMVPI